MDSFEPKISVVIPVYNGENYLRGAIESAVGQTYSNLEVLVVDDGSTDHGACEAIANSFGGIVRYVRKENGGVSSALNLGISMMQGEYMAWLSHDDIFLPRKFEKQIEFLRENQGVKALATGLDIIDDAGRITSTYSCGQPVVIRNGRQVMDYWVYGCSLLIARDVFGRVGLFNEKNRTVQDLEMWLRMVYMEVPIHMIPDVLCQWRHHHESDSFKGRAKHFRDVAEFFDRVIKRYPLPFFVKPDSAPSAKARQEALGWLGHQAVHRGVPELAPGFYRSALAEYPNVFSPDFLRLFRRFLASVWTRRQHPVG